MVNFPKIIKDLTRSGWTQREIAAAVGSRQTTISNVLHGAEPRYYLGDNLVKLHEKQRGK